MNGAIKQQRGVVRSLPLAIAHWRKDHLLWSQETLAKKASRTTAAIQAGIKVSPSTIAMIESGKRQPSVAVARAIAEAMDIPVGAFAFLEDDDDEDEREAA